MYTLAVARRNAYLHAVVSAAAEESLAASIAYTEAIARHFVQHDCAQILIENHLNELFSIWDVVSIAPRLGRHIDECIEVAVVEMKARPTGQRELKVHLGRERTLTVRVFDNTAEAESWFSA